MKPLNATLQFPVEGAASWDYRSFTFELSAPAANGTCEFSPAVVGNSLDTDGIRIHDRIVTDEALVRLACASLHLLSCISASGVTQHEPLLGFNPSADAMPCQSCSSELHHSQRALVCAAPLLGLAFVGAIPLTHYHVSLLQRAQDGGNPCRLAGPQYQGTAQTLTVSLILLRALGLIKGLRSPQGCWSGFNMPLMPLLA